MIEKFEIREFTFSILDDLRTYLTSYSLDVEFANSSAYGHYLIVRQENNFISCVINVKGRNISIGFGVMAEFTEGIVSLSDPDYRKKIFNMITSKEVLW